LEIERIVLKQYWKRMWNKDSYWILMKNVPKNPESIPHKGRLDAEFSLITESEIDSIVRFWPPSLLYLGPSTERMKRCIMKRLKVGDLGIVGK
jgi:hypothetical protein